MSYKSLEDFKAIFNREDFSYISYGKNIEYVQKIIMHWVRTPDGNEVTYKNRLKLFLDCLVSFYNWLNAKNINAISAGYLYCREELLRIYKLLDESNHKRTTIPRGVVKRFNKLFFHGLNQLHKGIKEAFDPNLLSKTGIEQKQIVGYLLDKHVGLGRKFAFNKVGNYAAANRLGNMKREELIKMMWLLLHIPSGQKRTFNGWLDLGARRTPFRVLMIPTFFRFVVCFIYKNSGTEKTYYMRQLNKKPTEIQIEAA